MSESISQMHQQKIWLYKEKNYVLTNTYCEKGIGLPPMTYFGTLKKEVLTTQSLTFTVQTKNKQTNALLFSTKETNALRFGCYGMYEV